MYHYELLLVSYRRMMLTNCMISLVFFFFYTHVFILNCVKF